MMPPETTQQEKNSRNEFRRGVWFPPVRNAINARNPNATNRFATITQM